MSAVGSSHHGFHISVSSSNFRDSAKDVYRRHVPPELSHAIRRYREFVARACDIRDISIKNCHEALYIVLPNQKKGAGKVPCRGGRISISSIIICRLAVRFL